VNCPFKKSDQEVRPKDRASRVEFSRKWLYLPLSRKGATVDLQAGPRKKLKVQSLFRAREGAKNVLELRGHPKRK